MIKMYVADLIEGCVVIPRDDLILAVGEMPVFANTIRRKFIKFRKQGWVRGPLFKPQNFTAKLYKGPMLYLGKEYTPQQYAGVRTHYTFLVEGEVTYLQGYEVKHLQRVVDIYSHEHLHTGRSCNLEKHAGKSSL